MGSGESSSGWQSYSSPTQGPDYTNQGKTGNIGLGYKQSAGLGGAFGARWSEWTWVCYGDF